MLSFLRISVGVWLLLLSAALCAEIDWRYEDRFTVAQRDKLEVWVRHADAGIRRLLGDPPRDYRVHFYRRWLASEPVPWAETDKGGGISVDFHVDPNYSLNEFKADWTASHELVHLLFPYLGEDDRWFAEGIASYFQYQVMYANGTLGWGQVIDRYKERFARAGRSSNGNELSIVELSRQIEEYRAFVRLYWGGAAYFLRVDQRLAAEKGLRLTEVVSNYTACCYRPWGEDAASMMRQFDRLSRSKIFTQTYAATVLGKGFPETKAALAWLAEHPPTLRRTLRP